MDTAMRFDETYQVEVPTDDAEFFIATAQWLIQAGYLHGQPNPYVCVNYAVLTAKGLEVLKAIPDSVSSKATIGEQLASTAKSGGKEIARGLVSQAFSIGTRLISPLVGLTP